VFCTWVDPAEIGWTTSELVLGVDPRNHVRWGPCFQLLQCTSWWVCCEKVAHARLPSVGFRSWSRFLVASLQVTWVINLVVGCHYFLPGLQLPSWYQFHCLVNRGMMGVNNLPKTYLTASRLRFEPRPYCAWVQHANHSATEPPLVCCILHWVVTGVGWQCSFLPNYFGLLSSCNSLLYYRVLMCLWCSEAASHWSVEHWTRESDCRHGAHHTSTEGRLDKDVCQRVSMPALCIINKCPVTFAMIVLTVYKCKKLNSLKHLVRTTVAGSHN